MADITLLDLSYNAPQVKPVLAEKQGDVLHLNVGDRAAKRKYMDILDGGEEFILSGSGGNVTVTSGEWSHTYTGISKVIGNAGKGKDILDASALSGRGSRTVRR